MNEGAGSKGIERICSHRIEWWLDTGADEQITELDEVSIEHIQQCLVEGYIEGELCVCRPDTDEDGEVYGWWQYVPFQGGGWCGYDGEICGWRPIHENE